jgi:hypothetical protein
MTHKVIDYQWLFEYSYQLVMFRGAGESNEDRILLQGRSRARDVLTRSAEPFAPSFTDHPNIDIDISWILRTIADPKEDQNPMNYLAIFSINREKESCRTPRRNEEIEDALHFFSDFDDWCDQVQEYFQTLVRLEQKHPEAHGSSFDLNFLNANGLFVPTIPIVLTEESTRRARGNEDLVTDPCRLPGVTERTKFLNQQHSCLQEKYHALDQSLHSDSSSLLTSADAKLIVTILHTQQICCHYSDGINYLEDLLRKQLIQAIGKAVKPLDFFHFMKFHLSKLYAVTPECQPKPFCYSIRRSNQHAPEGLISLEMSPNDGSMSEPICTFVTSSSSSSLQILLNTSTSVTLHGEKHLHSYLFHQFSQESSLFSSPSFSYSLKCEARQFSSFILFIGRMTNGSTFKPSHGTILRNKDDLLIPLLLEMIPSVKEFKEAISSLSPEQQRFAQNFRNLQLEGTVFAMCSIQIKPQLERVLNLPLDSLTKEIELTENLMDLFLKYQIPSDLLSYSDNASGDTSPGPLVTSFEKIQQVKTSVNRILGMINQCKAMELKEREEEARLTRERFSQFHFGEDTPQPDTLQIRAGERELVKAAAHAPLLKGKNLFGSSRKSKKKSEKTSSPRPPPADTATTRRSSGDGDGGEVITEPKNGAKESSSSAKSGMMTDGRETKEASAEPQLISSKHNSLHSLERDITQLPQLLEKEFEIHDRAGAVRPTIIHTAEIWTKRGGGSGGLLRSSVGTQTDVTVTIEDQKRARGEAFDLLDALSKSGGIPIHHSTFHVLIAMTHHFERDLLSTVIEDNLNPIEQVEKSSIILTSAIHQHTGTQPLPLSASR